MATSGGPELSPPPTPKKSGTERESTRPNPLQLLTPHQTYKAESLPVWIEKTLNRGVRALYEDFKELRMKSMQGIIFSAFKRNSTKNRYKGKTGRKEQEEKTEGE